MDLVRPRALASADALRLPEILVDRTRCAERCTRTRWPAPDERPARRREPTCTSEFRREVLMYTRTGILLVCSLTCAPAFAQFRVEVTAPVPEIRFAVPPPLVVVEPGVQVVE